MRILYFAFVFGVLTSLRVEGQNQWQEQYPFLKLEESDLRFPGGVGKFNRFLDRLDALAFSGEGRLQVVHMGGSHVQAGTLSDGMRKGLQRMSPGLRGERGFLFPFSLAKTNEPYNYSVWETGEWDGQRCSVNQHEARWGMSGIVATTTDSTATVRIRAYSGDTSSYAFTSVRVYHPPVGDSLYIPIVDTSEFRLDTSYYDDRGFTEFQFNRPYKEFKFGLKSDSTRKQFILQGIQFMDGWPGISYHALGVNGASTKSYLRCEDLPKNLEAIKPDLVIFGIGINDAYMSEDRFDAEVFEARYDSIMDLFEAVNPEVVFLFLTNNDSYYRRRFPNPNALAVSEVMYRLAEERDAAVWDLFAVMGGLGSIDTWVDYDLARGDRIHMTRAGYELQARLLTDAIERSWLNRIKEKADE